MFIFLPHEYDKNLLIPMIDVRKVGRNSTRGKFCILSSLFSAIINEDDYRFGIQKLKILTNPENLEY